MYSIFDTHAHYGDEAFDEDREVLLENMPTSGVGKIVEVGASIASSKNAIEIAKRYAHVYCSLGVHPEEIGELGQEEVAWLENESKSYEKCVAIGEIGLDYHWEGNTALEQKKWFECQMEIARRVKLPVIIHSRDAAKDTADMMRALKAGEIGGVVHCYSYSKEMAREFLDMDFFFGIGGVLTYKNARKLVEAAEYIPLDKIVLETDSPYLSPVPNRGQRNDSRNISFVVTKLSEIKGVSEDEILKATWENAHKLYSL